MRASRIAALLLLGTALATGTAFAATDTWNGGTSVNWADAGNWTPGAPATTGDSVVLAQTGSTAPSNQNIAGLTLNSLTFDTAANTTSTFTNGYNIGGTGFGIASGGTIADNAANQAADQINVGVTLNGPAAITLGSGATGLVFDQGITGTGPVTISNSSGAGSLVFLGTTNYTGGTTINAGSLQLGNGTTNGTLAGNVALASNSSNLTFDEHTSVTYAGVISGNGSVTVEGAGAVFTGANTYTGGTTVSAGTLQLGDGTTNGTITGDAIVDTGATLAFNEGSTVTYSGAISNLGAVTVSGAGTVIFTGANTYTGGTTIASGSTLQIGSDSLVGSIAAGGNVDDEGALDFHNTTANFQYGGVISGAGSVSVDQGTVIYTAVQTYQGTTTIGSGATLQVGAGAVGGITGGGAISDYGTLTFFNIGSSATISGGITDTGHNGVLDVEIGSGNTLILTGTNSLTPALPTTSDIQIVTGTLQIGAAGTPGTLAGNVSDLGTLDFNNVGATPLTFAGSIAGTGSLQVDSGTVILTNGGNYVSSTNITGGTLQIGDGTANVGSLYSATITDNGTLAFAPPTGQTLSISGNISGNGIVTQNGPGTTVLTGTDSFNGDSTVQNGTLEFGSGATFSGTGMFTVSNGATLAFAPSSAFTFANYITGAGNLSVAGTAPLILTNTDDYTGTTSIAAGSTLQIGNSTTAGGITGTSGVAIAAAGNLDFVNSSASTFSAPISGMGSVTVDLASGSTIAFTGTNSYSGGTNLESGTLQVGTPGNIGAGAVTFTGGTLQFTGNSFNYSNGASIGTGGGTFDTNGNVVTWSGLIANGTPPGGLTVEDSSGTGVGVLVLTNNDTYSGTTTIASGALQLGNGATNGNIAGPIVDNAVLDFYENSAATYADTISGSGVVAIDGNGTTAPVTLSGTNTYTGNTYIDSNATLKVASDANLGADSGTIVFAPGSTLGITASGAFAHNATVAGDPTFNIASGTTTTWNGTISDGASAGTVNVAGGGTLVLTNAANSYSGGTTVIGGSTLSVGADGDLGASTGSLTLGGTAPNSGGTLDVTSGFTLGAGRAVDVEGSGGTIKTESGQTFEIANGITGSGSLTASGPGTFVLAGTNTYTGNTNISAGGTLQLGDGTTAGTIASTLVNDNGALFFNEAGNLEFTAPIQGTGSVTQNDTTGGTLTLTGAESYTGGTTITSGTLQLGDGTTAGSVAGNIADNAALIFNEPASASYGGVISGSGTVEVSGTSTLTLTANNTYTGQTTIDTNATLQIGSGGATGSIGSSSAIVDNGTLTIDTSGQTLLTGGISGTGTVSQIGAGTTILAGTNTYNGPTTVTGGKLQIGNGGTSGSLTSDIADGGTVVFDRSDSYVYAGKITGNGGVTIADGTNGVTVFTGDSTYSGATAVTSGTLQIGNGAAAGSLTSNINVGTNANLTFSRSDSSIYGGSISGSGTVTIADGTNGVTVLTGNSTYTGATTVSGGTLQIGNDGTSGSLASSGIVDDASVVFDRSDSSTYAGTITGTGSVTQDGNGTTILTADNSYAGGTTIDAGGTLQLGNATGTGAVTGNITDNGTLDFDRSNAYTYNGVISGGGGVTQSGAGQTTLTAPETYTGATAVNSGTLLVTGSIASTAGTTVGSGGTLGGTGTIAGKVTVNNNGMITAGGGSGTLTVDGNFILGPGANYVVGVTPTTNDKLAINGTATLDGGLIVTPSGTGFSTTPIEILSTTGGITGKFSSFTVFGSPNEIPLLSYSNDDVFLTFAPTVTSLLPASGTNTNQSRVADAIDFALTHDNAITFLPVTAETGTALSQTLSELSGETAVAFQNVAVSSVASFMNTMFDPSIGGRGGLGAGIDGITDTHANEQLAFNGANSDTPYQHPSFRAVTVWTNFYGYENTTDADQSLGTHRTSATQYGGTVGLDYRPKHGDGSLGIAVGMTGNTWNLSNQLGNGQATAYQIGAYYSRRFFDTYFTGGLSYARYSTTTDRTVNLGGENLYHADFVSNSVAARAEAGHVFHTDIGRITPYARFQADDIGVPHYSEVTQAGSPNYALTYTGKQHYDYTTEVGTAWSALIDRFTDVHARAGWLHDYAGGLNDTATFSDFNGASFLVDGASPPRDAAHVVLGIAHNVNDVVLSLNAEAAIGGSSSTYGGTASIAYKW